ncbi:MAG: adenylate cyclase, partial [Candidatus Rokuibacteriota bacterium]
WSLAGAYMTLGFVHLSQGHLDEAGPVLDRGLAFSREMDLGAWLPMLLCARGAAHARSGRAEEGVLMLEEGVRRASALRILSRHALRLAWLAEGYLLAGRVDGAAGAADQAQRLAAEHAEQGYAAMAVRMLGETATRTGQGTRAAEHYADALARARVLAMRPLAAVCQLGLGELARRAGDGAVAKERLTEAVGLLREMDMRYWLPRAEAALREV